MHTYQVINNPVMKNKADYYFSYNTSRKHVIIIKYFYQIL